MTSQPAPVIAYERVPWKRILLFAVIAYALFAIAAIPFWFLPGGITHPLFTWVIGAGMWSPAIASVILAKGVEKTSWRTRVGLRFRGRWRRILLWIPLAVLIILLVQVLCALLTVLRGVPGDLSGVTWARTIAQLLTQQTGQQFTPALAATLMIASTILGIVVTVLFTLGEEIGWRGWLWPALKPLGRVRAAIVGGAIWSLWHLPIVLIGFNYAGAPRAAAVAMFLLPCMAMTLLFGGITDRCLGNPIPAAFGHATLNSTSALTYGIISTAQTAPHLNVLIDTSLGLIGVVVLTLAAVAVTPWGRRVPTVPALDPMAVTRQPGTMHE